MQSSTEIPKRQTRNSAGYDFYMPYDLTLKKGWFRRKWYTIDTGVKFDGTEEVWMSMADHQSYNPYILEPHDHLMMKWLMLLVPRSGLSMRNGTEFRNTVGIIDMDYRDTIKITVSVDKKLVLKKGDRLMQGILLPFGTFVGEVCDNKERTGGHGSTGQ